MPDFWTRTLVPTLRQAPGDAEVPSHQLMLRAGLIHKLGSGSYGYLPLGLRSLEKVCRIIREEMHAAGAAEVVTPCLQPIDLWERTGRRAAYGENLFVVEDRHGRTSALGPTAEEVITDLVGHCIKSYKDLPKCVYQIQTKFRDEFRPRFGVLRSREFLMTDGYSFHTHIEGPGGIDEEYENQYAAYERIFNRCGLDYVVVDAETGEMGGRASHQFTVLTPVGEDTIFSSDKGNYAANLEKAGTGTRPHDFAGEPTGEIEKVHTPDCPGIDDVQTFFKKQLGTKLKPQNMLKTIVCCMTAADDDPDPTQAKNPWYLLAVVRGDHEVNDEKLKAVAEAFLGEGARAGMAPEKLATADGFKLGFVGPHAAVGRDDTVVAVDPDAAQGGFWVTGANEVDHHIKHFNWQRDLIDADGRAAPGSGAAGTQTYTVYAEAYPRSAYADAHLWPEHAPPPDVDTSNDTSQPNPKRLVCMDLRNAIDGDPSPLNDGGTLKAARGIEVGQVFKLGRKYTEGLGVTVTGENNEPITPLMGCYGIGVNRVLAAAIESQGEKNQGHDESGIIWPVAIAPYAVCITPIAWDDDSQVADVCKNLAAKIADAGYDVIIDDRDERPGVKFKDADLVGFPLRITVGDKGLSGDTATVELKARDGRNGPKGEAVPLQDAVKIAVELLNA